MVMPHSRIRDVIGGKLAWVEVDLLDISDASAHPLRNALEAFGIQVNLRPIGQPRHVVAALGGDRPVAPYVIVGCHGDDCRILLPELGGPVARAQPFNDSLGPEQIRNHLRLLRPHRRTGRARRIFRHTDPFLRTDRRL